MSHFPEAGEVFAGFQLQSVLGQGGFATVFRASNANGTYALKVLLPDENGTYGAAARGRLAREIEALAALRTPHVVRLFGHGEDRGLIYMVFEMLPGEDLADLLEKRSRLTPAEVVHILEQLLDCLEEAHAAGVLHRDLKPDNIHVVPTAHDPMFIKLLDFGIARSDNAHHPSVTRTGELVGTPRYMSPEQLTGQPLTPASDIYSLGMVAYELLMGTGQMPGTSIYAQLERLHTDHVFTLDQQQAVGPLANAVQRMTAREASQRPQSARAAKQLLHPSASTHTRSQTHTMDSAVASTSRPVLFVLAIGLLLLVGAAFGAAAQMYAKQNEAAPVTVPAIRENPLTAAPISMVEPVSGGAQPDVGPAPDAGVTGCGKKWRGGYHKIGSTVVVLPSEYEPDHAYPLVVMVHDSFQKPDSWVRETKIGDRALEHGFVVVAPSDFDGAFGYSSWLGVDAVDKMRASVDWARDNLCVDPKKISLVAQGTGAAVVLETRCEPWVSAAVIHGFSPPLAMSEPFCPEPAPTLWLHAMKSKYGVARDGEYNCLNVSLLGVESVERGLRESHACAGEGKISRRPDGECETWTCETPLEFCRINGGGRWPGSGRPDAELLNPKCTGDLDTTFPSTSEVARFLEL